MATLNYEFLPYNDEIELKAGFLLKLKNGKLVLIGHLNASHGSCCCCSEYSLLKMIDKYAVLCELPQPFPLKTDDERRAEYESSRTAEDVSPPEPDYG